MTTKKHRLDTSYGAAETFKSAQVRIAPPAHTSLHAGAEAFYNAVIESRDASMWNDVDLARAVSLANYQRLIQTNCEALLMEGEVVTSERGAPMQNPRIGVLSMFARLEISLSKALQTDAASTQGRSRDNSKKNKAAQDAKQILDSFEDDDLIPMATH